MNANEAVDAIYAGTLDLESRAFWRYCTTLGSVSGNPLDLLDKVERRVLSKATSGAGGYLVPSDFESQIVSLRRAGSRIRRVARELVTPDGRQLQVGTATARGTSTWTPENASFTASDDTFGQVTLSAFKGSTLSIVSEELLADSGPDLDSYLADEFAGRQVALEETAFAVGDGSGKPLGMAHSTSGYTVAIAATGSTTVFKTADVATAYAALGDAYIPNASWLMAPSAFRSIAGITDTAGAIVFSSMHLAEPTLYGRPVLVVPDLPTSVASARSVVFGDIRQAYTVRRVSGLGLQRVDELYSNNGQVGFRLFERADGRPVDLAAAVILRHSAT
jgi:HK97 family phage major capsid protein